ncbi:MAG TPA: hypothetical protein VN861_10255 [Candidatus Acidoferrales bacterium]|nr:hypothetical protein [Candidatus Acidoferrales bacterium]
MRPFALARILCVALFFGFVSQAAFAQGPNAEIGFKFFGSYDGTAMDTVNLMNGNLTLHIPLPFYYAQRGAKLDPRYFLVANSKSWSVQTADPGNTGVIQFWTYGVTEGQHFNPESTYNGAYIATSMAGASLFRTYVSVGGTGGDPPPSASATLTALMSWDGASHPFVLTAAGAATDDTTAYQVTLSNPDQYGVPQTGFDHGPERQRLSGQLREYRRLHSSSPSHGPRRNASYYYLPTVGGAWSRGFEWQ